MVFVFSLPLSVALCNISLGISSDNIKSALGILLKPAGLWQYAVSVLVRKDSVRIFFVVNQNNVISSRDTFKTKLVNLLFGCTAFKISDLVSQVGGCTCFILHSPESYQCQCFAVVIFNSLESLNAAVSKTDILHSCHIWWKTPGCCCCYRCQNLTHLAVDCKRSLLLLPKLSSNTSGGSRVFKPLFAGSISYAKAAVFVVFPVVAAADMNLDFGGSPKTTTPMLLVVSSAFNIAVESRLAFLKSHLNKLSVLIKSLVKLVGALVVLVTKLLSTPPAMNPSVKECMAGLTKQNKDLAVVASIMQKRITHLEKKCEQTCLENATDNNNMVDNNNDDDKDFSVYDNTFDVSLRKSMGSMVKNSHKFMSIISKMYELDIFDTLSSKDSTSI
ncbi:hypothetical protein G9A89_018659 [Geosiphon pyriformis]|nr:hypothetical protein G9A89_018659 [Geosiphon pyriformis]